jgi:hypothetical protein
LTYELPVVISAIVFALYLVFRMRPALTRSGRESASALGEAKARIEAAKDDAARATALADAGDACVRLGRLNSAAGFYSRALRMDPRSATLVGRAEIALARRSSSLELLMWKHLGAAEWSGPRRDAVIAALRVLERVYAKRPRHHVRAEAITHALAALGEPEGSRP